MRNLKNEKGITLSSLIIYIIITFVVIGVLMRALEYFRGNIEDLSDVSDIQELDNFNLYFLDEVKLTGNKIDDIDRAEGTYIQFTSGNKYSYIKDEKTIYLNDTIKLAESIDACTFETYIYEETKTIVKVTLTVGETTKEQEYVMQENNKTSKIEEEDYTTNEFTTILGVGAYVNYQPDGIPYSTSYRISKNHSGYTSDQTAYQQETTWQIFNIDKDAKTIELISSNGLYIGNSAGNTAALYLKGADGYNNGVDILNLTCQELYSKSGEYTAIARNINMEDIDAKTNFEKNNHIGYGTTQTTKSGSDYTSRPRLYEQEFGYKGSTELTETTVTRSQNVGLGKYSSSIASVIGSLKSYITYYTFPIGEYCNSFQAANLLAVSNSYYVSTRTVSYTLLVYPVLNYNLFKVKDGVVDSAGFYTSTKTNLTENNAIRPIITLSTEEIDLKLDTSSEKIVFDIVPKQ